MFEFRVGGYDLKRNSQLFREPYHHPREKRFKQKNEERSILTLAQTKGVFKPKGRR